MQRNIENIMNKGGIQPPPPPAPMSPPARLRRRFSVDENFQPGHHYWTDGYDDQYVAAFAGEVVEEVLDGASNEHYVQVQKGDRTGYIPRDSLTQI